MLNLKNWSVYLLECSDFTFYCGVCITENMCQRLDQHNSGKGAKYTSGRAPVSLLTQRLDLTKSEAYRLERLVKRQQKSKKLPFLKGWKVE